MKKVLFLLLVGLLLAPTEMFAEKYNSKKILLAPHNPKAPSTCIVDFYLNENSGDFAISPFHNVTGFNITLTGNGVTYIDTTISLNAGQSYTNTLAGYSLGTYILTMSTSNGVIEQYEITITAD